eukprot:COSAG04_NODE_3018_length_3274_cov_2.658268_1_plen_330_part_00
MPDALEVAQQLDATLRTGPLVGPLHGVVMAVKDQFDTFDLRTTGGADTDWADDRPPRDATFVARLRAAGAIIIAKANMGEMASGVPRSAFGGVFSNPYDTLRSPSGSSSGSGSSVAANLCCCAIGGESGSSIRGPASANNLVGIAPTQELVSRDGMLEAGLHTRIGPLCRTVADAAKVLDVIAGYDPRDEMTAFAAGRGRLTQPLASAVEPPAEGGGKPLAGLRVGVLSESSTAYSEGEGAESWALFGAAPRRLEALGAEVVESDGSFFAAAISRHLAYVLQPDDPHPEAGATLATLQGLAAGRAVGEQRTRRGTSASVGMRRLRRSRT